MKKIIIQISRGQVTSVLTDIKEQDINTVILDWDNISENEGKQILNNFSENPIELLTSK